MKSILSRIAVLMLISISAPAMAQQFVSPVWSKDQQQTPFLQEPSISADPAQALEASEHASHSNAILPADPSSGRRATAAAAADDTLVYNFAESEYSLVGNFSGAQPFRLNMFPDSTAGFLTQQEDTLTGDSVVVNSFFRFNSIGLNIDPYNSLAYTNNLDINSSQDSTFNWDRITLHYAYERFDSVYTDTVRTNIEYPRYRLNGLNGTPITPIQNRADVEGTTDPQYDFFIDTTTGNRIDSTLRDSTVIVEITDDGDRQLVTDTLVLYPIRTFEFDADTNVLDTLEVPPRDIIRLEQELRSFIRVTTPERDIVDTLFITFSKSALARTADGGLTFNGLVPVNYNADNLSIRDYWLFQPYSRSFGRPFSFAANGIVTVFYPLRAQDTATPQIVSPNQNPRIESGRLEIPVPRQGQFNQVGRASSLNVTVTYKSGRKYQPVDTVGLTPEEAIRLGVAPPAEPVNSFGLMMYNDQSDNTPSTDGYGFHFGQTIELNHRYGEGLRFSDTNEPVDTAFFSLTGSDDRIGPRDFIVNAYGFPDTNIVGSYLPTRIGFIENLYADIDFQIVRPDNVGLDDPQDAAQQQLSLYPNPTQGALQMEFDLQQSAPTTIQVFNLLGEQVESHALGVRPRGQQTHRMDMSHLDEGIYFIQVQSGRQRLTQKLQVVR